MTAPPTPPRPLARLLPRPIQAFVQLEAAGGMVLVAATVVALVWANSPWDAAYDTAFHQPLDLALGSWRFDWSLGHLVDDALMALFFFIVGLEIKREWVVGELRDRRAAALPAIAALGGMVVPALLYLAVNAGGDGASGWGIPMATDIAFALGIVAVLGSRVPGPLKVFLLTLAIVDDIGAIVVIAAFYSGPISLAWLGGALLVLGAIVLAKRLAVRALPAYVALGIALWWCTYQSGVHATIAGVALGLFTPALPLGGGGAGDADDGPAPTDSLIHALHPWTTFLVVPLFALANAGIDLGAGTDLAAGSEVLVGVVLGLVVGKAVGISVFSWLAIRLGVGVLPSGARFSQLIGVAAVAGIGFTVSLFVAGLAFEDELALLQDAKVGILVASVLAAAIGSVALSLTARRTTQH